jgi:uncharacterized protein (DUF58 family)
MRDPLHPALRRLDTLEPQGSQIQLEALLRWRLAASQLPLRNRCATQQSGTRRSSLRGRGIDFDEVRLYQPGDDVRTIDWRVTARTSQTHTKVFREERERPVLLLVDLRANQFFGSQRCFKSVITAHAAALLAWAAVHEGDRIGAVILDDEGITDIRPRRSRHTLLQILRKMVAVQLAFNARMEKRIDVTQSPSLFQALQQVRAVSRPGSCLIVLSDFHDWDEACLQALIPLVRHSQCFAVRTADALEQAMPAVGEVRLRFGSFTLAFDSNKRGWQERFTESQLSQQARWQKDWRRLQSASIDLMTTDDVLPALRRLLLAGDITTGGT